MIRQTSMSAYEEIKERLPDCIRPVYEVIFHNPNVCIGEIGSMLRMQNSTVSGRVGDLLEMNLIHYGDKKESPITGKSVHKIRANNVFAVDPKQIKRPARKSSLIQDRSCGATTPDAFLNQKELFTA